MIPLMETKLYDVGTDYKESKILIKLPDGGRAMVKHKTILLHCVHRRTKDKITFRITGKGNFYEDEKKVTKAKAIEELTRLADNAEQADMILKVVSTKMILGI